MAQVKQRERRSDETLFRLGNMRGAFLIDAKAIHLVGDLHANKSPVDILGCPGSRQHRDGDWRFDPREFESELSSALKGARRTHVLDFSDQPAANRKSDKVIPGKEWNR